MWVEELIFCAIDALYYGILMQMAVSIEHELGLGGDVIGVIETGRTHQIRIHAASLGCPIVGDELYGDAVKDRRLRVRPARALLHAVMLSFPHPATGKIVEFAAEPPADIIYAMP